MLNLVSSEWLGRPAIVVAPDLIGCTLVRQFPDGTDRRGVIVETEAYAVGDPAFHAYRGMTPRNQIVFAAPGHVYVYFIYGMYHCFNIVTDQIGIPSAVLIRALELEFLDTALTPKQHYRRAAGPGKLCRELQIDRSHNGLFLAFGEPLWLEHRQPEWQQQFDQHHLRLVQTTRIGLTQGVDLPWRWYLENSAAVSQKASKPKN